MAFDDDMTGNLTEEFFVELITKYNAEVTDWKN
jgi:hypothetical protein